MERVLVLGGGSGGTILANSLSSRRFRTTLVSSSTKHLFGPGLLYVAFTNAAARIEREERSLLGHDVRFVHATVSRVDLHDQVVQTADGEELEYDRLVVATGIRTDPSQIPGVPEVVMRVGDYHSTVAQARKLWESLDAFGGGTIALGQTTPVCKCPPSPIEGVLLADQLLRRRGLRGKTKLVFFTPYPRPYPAEPMNRIIEPILKEQDIEVATFFDVDRIDPETFSITSIEGDVIECDLPILVPPFVGAPIAYEPVVVDASGFVVVDQRTLRIKGVENAFAIGDATNLPTSKSGVGAHLEAKVVARTLSGVTTSFDGRTNCPLDVGGGFGTFVAGSYDAPVVPAPPTRLKHLMKMGFARIYWLSLRGVLDPAFDVYFRATRPPPAADRAA